MSWQVLLDGQEITGGFIMGRTPQQAGAMARRKGNTFQNLVAKLLTEAWEVPVLWTPMSGGLSIRGDLMVGGNPPTHVMAYNVECKHQQVITLRRVLLDVSRIPVEPKQVVFFKDDGIIWMAWDVHSGPAIAPPQLGMKDPPVFIRIKHPGGEDSMLVGIVKINYGPGYDFLKRIRSVMVHKILGRTGSGRKKGGKSDHALDAETYARGGNQL